MGIGAGWYEHEWSAYGYGFPRAGERIAMLDEGVQIMRQLWTDGVATLAGKHYQVDGAICRPLPLQEGGIPLWIAGGGERKTLRIAAQYAQYTNFDGTPEVFAHKSEVLAEHCRERRHRLRRDRPLGELQRRHRRDREGRAGQARLDHGRTTSRWFRRTSWSGRPSAASTARSRHARSRSPRRLREVAGLGMTYAITYFAEAAYDRCGIELFASAGDPGPARLTGGSRRVAPPHSRATHMRLARTPHLARPSLEPVIPLQGGCTCLN